MGLLSTNCKLQSRHSREEDGNYDIHNIRNACQSPQRTVG